MPRSWAWIAAVALLAGAVLHAGPVLPQDRAADRPPPAADAGLLGLLPAPATTRHVLRSGERSLAYTATAGTLPLRDGEGKVTAALFYVAYTAEPPAAGRPVTFVANGGPGAAAAFLNLGAVGPRLLAFAPDGTPEPPPPRLVDNPDSWLDVSDLVFVDPVGTGYSRPAQAGEEAERRFYGVDGDASAMAAFIRLYLAQSGRTLAPVFLAGESYGGFRAARLTRVLPEEAGIVPSGAVLVSPALEFSLLDGAGYDLLPWATALPSLAATHLERQKADEATFTARLAEIERFALGDYLLALAAGPRGLTPAIETALVRATGLPAAVVAQGRGRIATGRFLKEYARADGRVLSRYDGAADGPDPEPDSPRASGPDPVLDRAVPLWTAAFVAYVREELGYRTELTYRLLNRAVAGRWDYGTAPSRQGYAGALDDLQAGRALNPRLQILVATGYTDLVTPYAATRYLLDQLPPLAGAAPLALRSYRGGHMMYMRPATRGALATDVRALYGRALATTAPGSGP